VHEPYGVSAQIIPWNYPLEMTARSLSAALATGNACVVKTPELDPLTNSFIAHAGQAAGLPKGALNILCGLGHEAGAALASHPGIDQIVFTGSVATGTAIARAAALNVVPCILELGGKSAAIVHVDADIADLVANVRWGIFFNAGQVCSAMSRLIVHESIHDEVVDAVSAMAKSLSVGPGIERPDFGANMGAMISAKQRDRAAMVCAQAQREGARAIAGGHAMNRTGHFLEPTVFDRVTPEMAIASDEIFGPVLSVIKFGDDEEAIAIANGTDYGLVGGVFTRDLDRATHVRGACGPGRSSSTNGTPAASKRPSAATASRAMAARRDARRSGTTCRPRMSQ
jgi:aldehyde dehydrogenase (NAD+)